MAHEDPYYWARRALDRDDVWHNKQNEITVESGSVAIKSAFVLNGGACIALLAFLANTITAEQLSPENAALVSLLTRSMADFAWGALLAGVASGVAYVVNRLYLAGSSSDTRHLDEPYIRRTPSGDRYRLFGNILNGLAVLAGVSSFALFMWGLLRVAAPFA